MFLDAGMALSAKWFYKCKNATGTVPDILGINLPVITRAHGKRLSCPSQKLVWLFVHADYWNVRIIWSLVYVKDIFHAGYEFCVFFLGDAPVIAFVRSKLVF